MKKTARYKMLSVRVTDKEQQAIHEAAQRAGLTVDGYIFYKIWGCYK